MKILILCISDFCSSPGFGLVILIFGYWVCIVGFSSQRFFYLLLCLRLIFSFISISWEVGCSYLNQIDNCHIYPIQKQSKYHRVQQQADKNL